MRRRDSFSVSRRVSRVVGQTLSHARTGAYNTRASSSGIVERAREEVEQAVVRETAQSPVIARDHVNVPRVLQMCAIRVVGELSFFLSHERRSIAGNVHGRSRFGLLRVCAPACISPLRHPRHLLPRLLLLLFLLRNPVCFMAEGKWRAHHPVTALAPPP